MLLINQASNNYMTMTLKEKATLSTPYYLFVFTSDVNRSEKIFTATDLSDYPARYNKFLITETSGTELLTSGVVTLSPTGFWSYKAYEQVLPYNLDVANTTSLVEQGRINVVGTPTTRSTYNKKRTYKAYGKGT